MNSFPDAAHLPAAHFFLLKIDTCIVALGYLLGSIPFGYLVGKARGIDIRQHGSGNIGATNVTRVLGRGAGRLVFAGDALKGVAAVLIGKWIASHHFLAIPLRHDMIYLMLPVSIGAISAAIACILGHNFPVWLGFKGGKGMATSAGVLIAMLPLVCLGSFLVWLAVFYTTRYVSLASIAAAFAVPLTTILLLASGLLHGWPYFYFAIAACLLAIWRHRSNMVRLLNGTESRFERKPKPEAAAPEAPPPRP